MQIKSLILKNFRGYSGETTITNQENGVVINLASSTTVNNCLELTTANGYTKHSFTYTVENGEFSLSSAEIFEIIAGKIETKIETVATERNNYLKLDGKTFSEYNTNNETPLDATSFIKNICSEKVKSPINRQV